MMALFKFIQLHFPMAETGNDKGACPFDVV